MRTATFSCSQRRRYSFLCLLEKHRGPLCELSLEIFVVFSMPIIYPPQVVKKVASVDDESVGKIVKMIGDAENEYQV